MPKRLASQPAKRLIAAAIALAILAGPAAAQYIQIGAMNPAYSPLNPLTPAQRNQLILQGRNAELQANQRVQQGLQYQQNQQIYRQLDRSQSQQIYGQLDRSRPQPRLKLVSAANEADMYEEDLRQQVRSNDLSVTALISCLPQPFRRHDGKLDPREVASRNNPPRIAAPAEAIPSPAAWWSDDHVDALPSSGAGGNASSALSMARRMRWVGVVFIHGGCPSSRCSCVSTGGRSLSNWSAQGRAGSHGWRRFTHTS